MNAYRASVILLVAWTASLCAAPAGVDLDALLNYPFVTEGDLAKAHKGARVTCEVIRAGGRTVDGEVIPQELLPLFERIAAFTGPERAGAETLTIEPFATSPDKAIVHLRERCKLPPPKGGAVVRLYRSREVMPEPIRGMFTGDIAGLNYCSRFVAVLVGDKSPLERDDTRSHELCHAYINSILGPEDEDKLPKWFHEGVALWISDCRDLYISHINAGSQRYTYSTADYKEYRTIFRYIKREHGEAIADDFIRRAIETRDADKLVCDILGLEDYEALRVAARGWGKRWEWARPQFWKFAVLALLLLAAWRTVGYFARRDLIRKYGWLPRPVRYDDADELDETGVSPEVEEIEEGEEESFDAVMLAATALRMGGQTNLDYAKWVVEDVTLHGVVSPRVRDAIALMNRRIAEAEAKLGR